MEAVRPTASQSKRRYYVRDFFYKEAVERSETNQALNVLQKIKERSVEGGQHYSRALTKRCAIALTSRNNVSA